MTICAGLTVLEIGSGSLAGSQVGMVLADNGARVLKIEPPEGDRLRRTLPSGFLVRNRGKESVVVDLRTAEGQARLRDLAAAADVVIEALGAGVADAWKVGDEVLRPANPALVYCSIKGFGSRGGYAELKAYEGVVAAKAGLFGRGAFSFRPGPIFSAAPMGSNGAAQMALAGVLAALVVRERTGRGQRVEATLAAGLHPLDYFGLMTLQYEERRAATRASGAVGEGGDDRPSVAASRYSLTLCTGDGRWIIVVPQLRHQADALLRATGLLETRDDPRFAGAPSFAGNDDAQAWEDLLWESFRRRTLDEWLPILRAEPDIPFEVAVSSEEALDHPQHRHNGNVVEVADPRVGPVAQVGPLAAFSATPSEVTRSAPALDEHGPDPAPPAPVAPGRAEMPAHPLAGTTIVELGYFYATPFGVTMAASLGARVIKIEPLDGDPQRSAFGGYDTGAAKPMEGKESISLDLRTAEGQRIVQELAARADVFVCGFRPGVPERLHVDHATLSAANPRLVYLHSTGYGVDGPYCHRPTYAMAAAASAGSLHRQAAFWLEPSFAQGMEIPELQAIVHPRLRQPVDGDANAADAVFAALLLGIYNQRLTGEGQFLSTSMITANSYCYLDDFNRYEGKPPLAQADAEQFGLDALYRLYPAAEGWVFLAATDDHEWQALVGELGRGDLLDDPRFSTAEGRVENDDALAAEVEAVLGKRSATDWESALSAVGVGCAAVHEPGISDFVYRDPVARATGLSAEVDHPSFGRVVRHGLPVAFSETPGRLAAGCLNGQHTRAIMAELGYRPEEIENLLGAGVIGDGS